MSGPACPFSSQSSVVDLSFSFQSYVLSCSLYRLPRHITRQSPVCRGVVSDRPRLQPAAPPLLLPRQPRCLLARHPRASRSRWVIGNLMSGASVLGLKIEMRRLATMHIADHTETAQARFSSLDETEPGRRHHHDHKIDHGGSSGHHPLYQVRTGPRPFLAPV